MKNILNKIFSNCHNVWDEQRGLCMEYGDGKTYGTVFDTEKKKAFKTHRLVCEAFNGKPKEGQVVNHLCCNPACCNPRHLVWTTPKDNVLYSILKGNRKLKLSTQDIIDIRASSMTPKQLAAHYNVSQAYISLILRNERRNQGY